ncbi:hypothetical protein D918_08520 [Trichuris suis]|nr:hypothetical protein D918_08520 [Trichuris suis]
MIASNSSCQAQIGSFMSQMKSFRFCVRCAELTKKPVADRLKEMLPVKYHTLHLSTRCFVSSLFTHLVL